MSRLPTSTRNRGHVVCLIWTTAFIAYDAYVWFIAPGWQQATVNSLRLSGPTFLPIALPLLVWVLWTLHAGRPRLAPTVGGHEEGDA